MRLLPFITILLAVLNYSYGKDIAISAQKEKAIELFIKNEQTVAALKLFTQEIILSGKRKDANQTADNIYWISECLFQLKKFTFLDSILETGIPFTRRTNINAFIKLQILKGKYLTEKGKHNECIQLLTKLSLQVKDNEQLCEIYLTLADAQQRLQLLDQSKKHYQYVLDNAKNIIQLARGNNGLGSYYCVLSDLDSASLYYNTAFRQFTENLGAQHSRTAQLHYNLGLIADRKFDLYEAEEHFTKALEIYKNRFGNLHPRTAETYGSLGSVYLMKDNPGKALYYSIKERDILFQLYGNDNPDIMYSYLSCGKIYYLLDDNQKAEEQLELAKKQIVNHFGKKHNLYSQCIVEISKIYTDRHEYKKASQMLSEAIQLKEKNPDDYLGDIHLQIGENYLDEAQFKDAEHHFKIAHKLYIQYFGKSNIYSIDPLIGLSNVYLKTQHPEAAYQMAEIALSMTKNGQQIIYPYDHWKCLVQLIQCKKMLYKKTSTSITDITEEIEDIKQTIQKANLIKNMLHTSGSQLYFAKNMAELNELGVYFLTHFYKKTDSFFLNNLLFFSENNKANLLRNKIINYNAIEILPEYEKAISSVIMGKLNYFISLNENQPTMGFNINDSILFYQNQYETFTKDIEQKYPKIYTLKYGAKPLTIQQIQDKLFKDYTLLEYCNDHENYYCLAISKNHITYKICGNKSTTDAQILSYQNSVIHKKADVALSHQLYTCLLPNHLEENILICADDIIQNVAFEALSANSKVPNYVIYNHTIQHTFSANTYFNHSPPVSDKNIVAFYPDFTNSPYPVLNNKKEHEALKSFSNYAVYHNENALKDNFIKCCNSAGIIHIGSHLIIDTLTPLKSFLVFQPTGNYTLSINEIWKLNANCQLITLASCQSNFGKQQSGEGMQNFAWAFHYAGARNILSTKWNASDRSTAAIISEFYKNLKNGKSKSKALQLAKLKHLGNADAMGAQPFFWSNFNLYGDNSRIDIESSFLVKFWWIPILLLLLCYLAIIFWNKIYRKIQYDHL